MNNINKKGRDKQTVRGMDTIYLWGRLGAIYDDGGVPRKSVVADFADAVDPCAQPAGGKAFAPVRTTHRTCPLIAGLISCGGRRA